MECARLLEEAGDVIRYAGDGEQPGGEAPPEVQKTYAALLGEFGDEIDRRDGAVNVGLGLDSIDTRFTAITGTPLRDGTDHLRANTIVNDYLAVPMEDVGFNQITGVRPQRRRRSILISFPRRIPARPRGRVESGQRLAGHSCRGWIGGAASGWVGNYSTSFA